MRYLDPKNDLIFKKIFGERPNIIISFLNALLPLETNQNIISVEYLPSEMVPEIPILKNSIVDVRCKDKMGRQFIVEMQMLWTDSFKSRVLFNASKAYVKQLDKSIEYRGLQPVYALSIVNENFESEMNDWYHHYKMVHVQNSNMVLDGLQLVFVELPKFKINNYKDKRLSLLWLRFLSEIENNTEMISDDLKSIPEIAQAIELTKESAYTRAELEAYERYWDTIRTEKTYIADAEAKGLQAGIQIGEERGIQIGEARSELKRKEEKIQMAKTLKSFGTIDLKQIAAVTGLEEIIKL
jgi:predicted transposase/invertase (TIGR01784 family)